MQTSNKPRYIRWTWYKTLILINLLIIDDLTYCFFVLNCLQMKLLLSLLRYISKYKAFISRSRTPATPKMETFVKENNGWKPFAINTKNTVLDVAGGL